CSKFEFVVMGKKQHQSDKLYLTAKEWKDIGGHKDDTGTRLKRAEFKRLPFSHCALSLLPFEDPVASPTGDIFDLTAIVPYLKKFGVNPCNGKKMTVKDLIALKLNKDGEGNFRCPVTFRIFTPQSHVVCIKPTGNVYAYESVYELNLKRNHLKDLLTDEPFVRTDIIDLQNPANLDKFNMEQFHHVKLDLKTKEQIAAEKKAMKNPSFFIRRMNNETKTTLDTLKKDYVAPKWEKDAEQTADAINAAPFSQGHVSMGFTSTAMDPITQQKAAVLADDVVRYARVKKNGYVRLVTNHGAINLELYCKGAPKACENFITHCRTGYYNNSPFHRIIKNFMMQGGDPTGTGKGGESIWGKPFEDEFISGLSHESRGVLSMANKGSNTNNSQFFITFRPCKYLDKKHTIFGRVVGGMDSLLSIEKEEVEGGSDRPVNAVTFMRAEVFVDPFEEAQAEIDKEREELNAGDRKKEAEEKRKEAAKPKAFGTGIGKYINPQLKRAQIDPIGPSSSIPGPSISVPKKAKIVRNTLSDFSGW
ncbi:hypothetical protein PFISCL1PPCAC_5568, partial [Pristionchus fissidentatus]